jgi:hypothetical protein
VVVEEKKNRRQYLGEIVALPNNYRDRDGRTRAPKKEQETEDEATLLEERSREDSFAERSFSVDGGTEDGSLLQDEGERTAVQ